MQELPYVNAGYEREGGVPVHGEDQWVAPRTCKGGSRDEDPERVANRVGSQVEVFGCEQTVHHSDSVRHKRAPRRETQ